MLAAHQLDDKIENEMVSDSSCLFVALDKEKRSCDSPGVSKKNSVDSQQMKYMLIVLSLHTLRFDNCVVQLTNGMGISEHCSSDSDVQCCVLASGVELRGVSCNG